MKEAFVRIALGGPLRDFLPPARRAGSMRLFLKGSPGLLDQAQAIGIPQAEIGEVWINGKKATLKERLRPGDRVRLEASRKTPRRARFIADVHLGKLARYLRLLGYDTLYRNDYADAEIVRLAGGLRIVLTRDIGLLKHKKITFGYWLRSDQPARQLREVCSRFRLVRRKPFSRCLACNSAVKRVPKARVAERLLAGTRRRFRRFHACPGCGRVYWAGSHYRSLRRFLARVTA